MELSQAHLRYLLAIGELSQGKAAVSSTQVARVLLTKICLWKKS